MSNATERRVRRQRGFEAAAGLVRDSIRLAGEQRGFAMTRLLTQWDEIAGGQLAPLARPVRVGYGREGLGATLTLLVSGAAAPLVQMQAETIRERVNGCYGYNAIARIRITQISAAALAEDQAAFSGHPGGSARTRPEAPNPACHKDSAALSRDIGDADLRAALEALGEKVLFRARNRKG